MKRAATLGLIAITLFACGGRTTLDDLSSGDAATPGSDGGIPGNDGGVIVDAIAPPPPSDAIAPPPFDGGPPPIDGGTTGTIQCGQSTCSASTDVCCVTFNGQSTSETCTPPNQCQGAQFDCSGAASCPPGEVCCGSFSQQKQGASCAPACQGGFQNPQICQTSAECPNGLTCKPTPLGFDVCRP